MLDLRAVDRAFTWDISDISASSEAYSPDVEDPAHQLDTLTFAPEQLCVAAV